MTGKLRKLKLDLQKRSEPGRTAAPAVPIPRSVSRCNLLGQ